VKAPAKKVAAKKVAPAVTKIKLTESVDARNARLAKEARDAKELETLPAAVCRRIGQSYSCIRVKTDDTHAYFIPMASMALEKAHLREFRADWEEFSEYPVRRAAEVYLEAGKYREIDPKVRDHLKAIVKDPLTVYNLTPKLPQPTKDIEMATAKTAPAKKTAAASGAPAGKGTISKTPVAAPNKPAAKTPAAKTPAAKTAPAKNAAAKTPAKNGIATVVSGAKPPAKNAATSAKAPPVRAANDEKLKVADATAARRGETAAYVEEAVKMKTFTRQQIADKMVSLGRDPGKARVKVADCVYWEIFVPV